MYLEKQMSHRLTSIVAPPDILPVLQRMITECRFSNKVVQGIPWLLEGLCGSSKKSSKIQNGCPCGKCVSHSIFQKPSRFRRSNTPASSLDRLQLVLATVSPSSRWRPLLDKVATLLLIQRICAQSALMLHG